MGSEASFSSRSGISTIEVGEKKYPVKPGAKFAVATSNDL